MTIPQCGCAAGPPRPLRYSTTIICFPALGFEIGMESRQDPPDSVIEEIAPILATGFTYGVIEDLSTDCLAEGLPS